MSLVFSSQDLEILRNLESRLSKSSPGTVIPVAQHEYDVWARSGKVLRDEKSFKVIKTETKEISVKSTDVNSTLQERANTHGDFADNGLIMQLLKRDMRIQGKNWDTLSMPQAEALEMIQHKIGRILSGNPNEPDHWKDIAGYATLVFNILTTGKSHVGQ